MSNQDANVAGMPGRYANALFDLAGEAKSLDQTGDDLSKIQSLIEASEDLKRLVLSPIFTADQQINAMVAILKKAKIKGLIVNFVSLVAKNRRLFALSDMIKAYHALLARHRGEVFAEVASAQELSQNQVKAIKTALKAAIGRDVNLAAKVDPDLLGGLVVKLGSRMIDNSLRNKLNNLKIAMKEVG